jgi:hypothetical protein
MEGALNYVINSFGLGIAFKWQIYLSQIILHVYNGPGARRLHDTVKYGYWHQYSKLILLLY